MTVRSRLAVVVAVVLGAGVLGAGLLAPSPARAEAPVTVTTVPPVAGYPITLDAETAVTDAAGVARFATTRPDDISRRLTTGPKDLVVDGEQVRVSPSRVFPSSTGAVRLCLDVSWPVRFTWSDVDDGPVDLARIDGVTVKSSTGEVRSLPAGEPSWLQGSRVVPLAGGLEVKKLFWTIQEVRYSGSNVVNAAQQRFQPADTQDVDVRLLFFSTTVTVRDAFFGFRTGSRVELTFPDGEVVPYALEGDRPLALGSLPRGDYSLVVHGPGPALTSPVALSRTQALDIAFYSWLDIGIVVLLLGGFALGTLAYGLRRRRRRGQPVQIPAQAEPAAVPS